METDIFTLQSEILEFILSSGLAGEVGAYKVPYLKADFLEKAESSDRVQTIKSGSIYLKVFIASCERLDLLPDAEMSASNQEVPITAERRRATKIARFKHAKAAESKLQDIKERRERRGRSRGAAAKGSMTDHGDDHVEDEFEEEEREAWSAQIALSLCKALDLLEMLKLEEELLAVRHENTQDGPTRAMLDERASKAEAWHKGAASRAKVSKPAQPITCATFAQDVIEGRASLGQGHDHHHQPLFGPASLVGDITTERQRLTAQVFQPSHRLPTMSIEDAGLTEMKIMKEWTERNAKLQEEANSSWARETKKDNESDDEAAEYKARAWDDWKDENPKGSGNKKLTPCG
ncbi:hypothetical protein L7F22_001345 [Adiantum nelumboides]|nr:hypothetical protein [Adiantum nelumboides]